MQETVKVPSEISLQHLAAEQSVPGTPGGSSKLPVCIGCTCFDAEFLATEIEGEPLGNNVAHWQFQRLYLRFTIQGTGLPFNVHTRKIKSTREMLGERTCSLHTVSATVGAVEKRKFKRRANLRIIEDNVGGSPSPFYSRNKYIFIRF